MKLLVVLVISTSEEVMQWIKSYNLNGSDLFDIIFQVRSLSQLL